MIGLLQIPAVQDIARSTLRDALESAGGNITEAARGLGMSRQVFSRYCAELGLNPAIIRARYILRTTQNPAPSDVT